MLLETMKLNYLNNVKVNLSDGTFRCYKCHLDYIINWLNTRNIHSSLDINSNILESFILDQHHNNIKNSTINKRIKPFKLMFRFNKVDNEILATQKLKEDKSTFSALTNFELSILVDYLNNANLKLQNRLLIFLLIDTGVRVNELLNIKVKNINFFNNTILLETTKTKMNRIVPFTNATSIILKEYLVNHHQEMLFTIKYSAVSSLFDRIKNILGLTKFHPHMLRHTLASKLHKNGVSVIMIKEIMGHTNVTTTERYIHFDIEDLLSCYNQAIN